MSVLAKIQRFRKRNKGHVFHAVKNEVIGKLYAKPFVRKILSPFVKKRIPQKWIFIVGCYNSGTTILREIMAAHPDVAGLPLEGVRFTNVFKRPEDLGWTRNWTQCESHISLSRIKEPNKASQLLKDWSPLWKKGAKIFMEKSITNIERMEWIDENLDNVYFLGITREPYCVSEGIKRRAFPVGEAAMKLGRDYYTYEEAASQWVLANQHLKENSKKVKHFKGISYEQFAENPEAILKDIYKFLELDVSFIQTKGGKLYVGDKYFSVKNMNQGSIDRITDENKAIIDKVIRSATFDHPYTRV